MDNSKLSIKNWSEDDRPREKLLKKGYQSLSNAELLAILLGSGNRDESAVELSKKILISVDNNLNELGRKSIYQLVSSFKGVGEAKAVTIMAALELGRRRKLEEALEKKKVVCSTDVFHIFHPILADLPNEEIWMLLLNRGNKVIDTLRASTGGTTSTVFDLKLILKEAIDRLACGIVLGHNHPSGNNQPSPQDRMITEKLKEACLIFDILLFDHIIIAGDNYFSFADAGMI